MTSKILSHDEVAVRNSTWYFADVQGNTMPVRPAQRGDMLVWTIDGKKVVVIQIPEMPVLAIDSSDYYNDEDDEDDIMESIRHGWAVSIAKMGPKWLDLAIAVYQDKWMFTSGSEEAKKRLDTLEEIKRNWGWL